MARAEDEITEATNLRKDSPSIENVNDDVSTITDNTENTMTLKAKNKAMQATAAAQARTIMELQAALATTKVSPNTGPALMIENNVEPTIEEPRNEEPHYNQDNIDDEVTYEEHTLQDNDESDQRYEEILMIISMMTKKKFVPFTVQAAM